jgi:nucleotide-binding universal stress UspA family protein
MQSDGIAKDTTGARKTIMIKDIVVNLSLRDSHDVATDFGVSAATMFEAHLAAVGFVYEPLIPVMIDMYGLPSEVIESQRVENERAAKAAVDRFNAAVRRTALSAQARTVDAPIDTAPGMFAQIARRFDLSVVAQPEPERPVLDRLIVEAALFDSGRPVLVVPYIQKAGLKLDHVMLCWDGSRSAARAAADAMPFIRRAKLVEVVTVASEPTKSEELPGADMAHHIARHGAKVKLERITTAETDVASTILSHAADVSADLLIMGGYGHSRLREFILGGVTRGILASMTIPTLLSH